MKRIAKSVALMGTGAALVMGGAGMAVADSGASGDAQGSPGVGSGSVVQVPVHVPANVCGNTADVTALLNPAFGSICGND